MPPAKERIELKCLHCGRSHFKLECQLTRGRGKYCSRKCAVDAGKNDVKAACFRCGSEFFKKACEMDCEKSFCSVACYREYRAEKMKDTTYKKIDGRHEHRIIVESILGRKLSAREIVHHMDENKHNNSLDNLALLPNQRIHALVHFAPHKVDIEKYRLVNLIK